MPEHVVAAPLLRVGQYVVGLVRLLEPLGGGLVALVAVRVVLHGQLPEGALQLVGGRASANSEDLVVVALDGH